MDRLKAMAIRDVILTPDERLRQKANKVKTFATDLKTLTTDMLETMRCCQGVGLAGPQIGIMQRIFVAEIPAPENPESEPHPQCGVAYVIINPEIIKSSRELVESKEGCLSIPGWTGLVNRPDWVTIQAQDLAGRRVKLKVDGLLARIFLHEIDHLNGVLFTDHIIDTEKLWQIEPEAEAHTQASVK